MEIRRGIARSAGLLLQKAPRRRYPYRDAPPELTVIVPVDSLALGSWELLQTLRSLRRLRGINMEFLLLNRTRSVKARAKQVLFTWTDRRFRLVDHQGIPLPKSMTHAVDEAAGTYIAFANPGTIVRQGAYAAMVDSLNRSDNDFAIANYAIQPKPSDGSLKHIDLRSESSTTVRHDFASFNKVFRKQYWLDQKLTFRKSGSTFFEPIIDLYTHEARADECSRLFFIVAPRLTRSVRDATEAHDLTVVDISLWRHSEVFRVLLHHKFPDLIRAALIDSADRRQRLGDIIRYVWRNGGQEVLHRVSPRAKILSWLVTEDRWHDADIVDCHFRLEGQWPPVIVNDGALSVDLTAIADRVHGIPDQLRILEPGQLAPHARIDRAQWESDTLKLTGWAYFRGTTPTRENTHIDMWLASDADGDDIRLPLHVERSDAPRANRLAREKYGRYEKSGFIATIDATILQAHRNIDRWELRATVTMGPVAAEAPVRIPKGAAWLRMIPARYVTELDRFVSIKEDKASRLFMKTAAPEFRVRDLATTADGRVVGTMEAPETSTERRITITAHCGKAKRKIDAPIRLDESGRGHFTLTVPGIKNASGGPRRAVWELSVNRLPVFLAPGTLPGPTATRARDQLSFGSAPTGELRLYRDAPLLHLLAIELAGTTVRMSLRISGLTHAELAQIRLVSGHTTISASAVSGTDEVTVDFPLVNSAGIAAPTGAYQIGVPTIDGNDYRPRFTPELLQQMPVRQRGDIHAVELAATGDRVAQLVIQPPLHLDELGKPNQQRLQDEYRTMDVTPIDGALFETFNGAHANDSQLEIYRELVRTGHDLEYFWSVADYSVQVPDGARPVVIGTREWYRILASVRYICNNSHYETFFHKRPHQRLLQTFHGHPSKTMGRSYMGDVMKFTPERLKENLDRRNREWDTIVVPSEAMGQTYIDNYDYRGEIIATGYPRYDPLVNRDDTRVRRDTLNILGVPNDKTVVLYAPTWRESLKAVGKSSAVFRDLNAPNLARALGDDYVILARGHDYNLRAKDVFVPADNLVDVTAYEDVNDLIQTADVAILDYSSLRFDWAITGKPMIFFVPDLAEYKQMRGFLFPYENSAPGPLCDDPNQVLDYLNNLPALTRTYADDIAAFNETFSTMADGKASQRVVKAFFDTCGVAHDDQAARL